LIRDDVNMRIDKSKTLYSPWSILRLINSYILTTDSR